MSKSFTLLFAAIILLGITSCNQNTIYNKEYELKEDTWSYDQALAFSFEIKDTSKLYDIVLNLEHTTSYEFENLYVNILTGYPDSKIDTQMVSLELANSIGMWLGDCGSKACELNIPIQQKVFFKQQGTYSITLEQYMRRDKLKSIHEVGLSVLVVGDK